MIILPSDKEQPRTPTNVEDNKSRRGGKGGKRTYPNRRRKVVDHYSPHGPPPLSSGRRLPPNSKRKIAICDDDRDEDDDRNEGDKVPMKKKGKGKGKGKKDDSIKMSSVEEAILASINNISNRLTAIENVNNHGGGRLPLPTTTSTALPSSAVLPCDGMCSYVYLIY